MIAGKVLGDLGADVIAVEPPGGNPSRNIAPFYRDTPDPEKSLFWFAYSTNKKSITVDIETAEGKELFRRLVKTANFVLESFPPEYMDSLGLGYEALSKINPRIIMTSITPFGASGPYAHYKASDLTTWAMGGYLGTNGAPDREPVWVCIHQASLHAGNNAASASMIAHWHREMVGEGQHIDVSTQQCVVVALYLMPLFWEFQGLDIGAQRAGSSVVKFVYSCKDGEVLLIVLGGISPIYHNSSMQLVKYMDENGMASDWLKAIDWVTEYAASTVTPEVIIRVLEEISEFLLTKTKKELYQVALERRILLAPIADARDVSENLQLQARDFWVDIEHPELADSLRYCGPFIQLSEAPLKIRRSPSLIGEHNEEVYGELGVSNQELANLKQARVI